MVRIASALKDRFHLLMSQNLFENYLPIFRVYIAFHIIKKVFLNWDSASLFLDGTFFQSKYKFAQPLVEANFMGGVPMIAFITVALALLFGMGIGKYVTTILLFFSLNMYFEPYTYIANGGDNLLYFVLIYMCFIDSYKYLSMTRPSKPNQISNFLSNLGVFSIMLHLCLIYFLSGVHKIHADVWLNGVATYYIMQLERFNAPINSFFVKNAFVIAVSTYATLLFELLFPFLVWNKSWRPVFLVVGILLHLGIYFTMMIYDFEILFIMIYGFFIPNTTWARWLNWLNTKPLIGMLVPRFDSSPALARVRVPHTPADRM